MNNLPKVIIFDCDGTILDTFLLIEKVVYKTFEVLFPDYPLTKAEADSFFGPLLDDTFKKYADSEEEIKHCVETYRYYCNKMTPDYVKAYDGIKELLTYLKSNNYKICMVSNKISEAIFMGLDICDLTKYFDFVVGAEMLKEAKPNPDGIYQVMNHFKVDQTILIGDTTIDMQTARNVNINFIGVTWCQTTEAVFKANKVKYIANHPNDIKQILEDIYGI